MLRVALIGAGDAGKHHARALAELHAAGALAWTALGVRDPARPVDFAMPARAMPVADAIAASDAVILATPDGLHRAHAEQVLAAGRHVLVEKPLALTSADAIAVVEAARAADRVLAVGYHLRHHAGHEAVRANLGGLVGRLRTIDVRWAWPDPAVAGWRAKGDGARWWSLAALGTHAIDLALWLAGGAVTEVAAVTVGESIDRAAEVTLRFPDDTLAHISCAITHRAAPTLAIAGDAGEVLCTRTLGARGAGTIVTRDGELAFAVEDPYVRQLRAFVARCAAPADVDRDAVTNIELLEKAR